MNLKANSVRSVAINGRFLSQPITGVQRYAFELLRMLDQMLSERLIERIPTTVFVPPNTRHKPSYSFLKVQQIGRLTGQLWEQIDLPAHARRHLLFTPCGGSPVFHIPHVITIHDAGVFSIPQAYALTYRSYYKTLQKILVRSATTVITVSDFSRRELITSFKLSEEKVNRTYLSGEHILRCPNEDSILMKHNLIRRKYVLAVSSRNPAKNFKGLIQAWSHMNNTDIRMAIAGGTNTSVFGEDDISSSVATKLGFVSDAELRSLYENAACFVFPSFYEGFGLPPLEALSLGCPVIVSRVASLPEIFRDAATFCDPNSPEDIAQQISRVLRGEHPRKEVAQQHAGRFTWESCARQTWEILMNALR